MPESLYSHMLHVSSAVKLMEHQWDHLLLLELECQSVSSSVLTDRHGSLAKPSFTHCEPLRNYYSIKPLRTEGERRKAFNWACSQMVENVDGKYSQRVWWTLLRLISWGLQQVQNESNVSLLSRCTFSRNVTDWKISHTVLWWEKNNWAHKGTCAQLWWTVHAILKAK